MSSEVVLISSCKNESPFILEFVAHHLVCGFDSIIIASNDCIDGSHELLQALAKHNFIKHVPCEPGRTIGPQAYAYKRILKQFPIEDFHWLLVLDIDELMNIHVGQGKVQDLIDSVEPDTDMIMINWACFGSGGHENWTPDLSSKKFNMRLRSLASQNGIVKTLTRNPSSFGEIRNHHMASPKSQKNFKLAIGAGARYKIVSAAEINEGLQKYQEPFNGVHSRAQVNHYMIRTLDSYLVRIARGRGKTRIGEPDDRHTFNYFRAIDRGKFPDTTILKYYDDVAALLQVMLSISDICAALEEALVKYQLLLNGVISQAI